MGKARELADLIGSKYLLDGTDPLSVSGNAVTLKMGDASTDTIITSGGGGTASRLLFEFLATAGQTVFAGNDTNATLMTYSVNEINVYVNGVRLAEDDYTATDGLTVTIATPLALNDVVEVEAFTVSALVETTLVRSDFVATASQTVFTTDYVVGSFWVTYNGALLNPADYTAVNGTTVTLSQGSAAGDLVSVFKVGTFSVADTYTKAEIDLKAPLASPTFIGTPTAPTATAATDTTQLASTAFVHDAITNDLNALGVVTNINTAVAGIAAKSVGSYLLVYVASIYDPVTTLLGATISGSKCYYYQNTSYPAFRWVANDFGQFFSGAAPANYVSLGLTGTWRVLTEIRNTWGFNNTTVSSLALVQRVA